MQAQAADELAADPRPECSATDAGPDCSAVKTLVNGYGLLRDQCRALKP